MSGFEVYSETGELTLSSDWSKSLVAGGPIVLDVGSQSASTVGIVSGSPGVQNSLYVCQQRGIPDWFNCARDTTYWCNIPSGSSVCRIGDWICGNPGTGGFTMREATNRNLNHRSGFLDVFDAAGNLTWSAASLEDVPSVQGAASFSRASVIGQTGGATTTVAGEPYFLLNSLLGHVHDDGNFTQTFAVCIYRSGSTYYCFSQYYRSGGSNATPPDMLPDVISIPYAYF